MCNFEKHINKFYEKQSECKVCNSKRGLQRYYENKKKISNQRKIFYEQNKDKLLQKQNGRCSQFKELDKTCFESKMDQKR